jgi:hypothetical protein
MAIFSPVFTLNTGPYKDWVFSVICYPKEIFNIPDKFSHEPGMLELSYEHQGCRYKS